MSFIMYKYFYIMNPVLQNNQSLFLKCITQGPNMMKMNVFENFNYEYCKTSNLGLDHFGFKPSFIYSEKPEWTSYPALPYRIIHQYHLIFFFSYILKEKSGIDFSLLDHFRKELFYSMVCSS